MLASTLKKNRNGTYTNDKVIGFQFYKGRAGYGIALVHERRVIGKRRDEVETYPGPSLHTGKQQSYVSTIIIETVANLLEYLVAPLMQYEEDVAKGKCK